MKDTVDSPKQQDAITNTQIATGEEADIQLPELENFLYECADIIRDRVDRTDYKEYILPLVFYKTFNDTYQDNYEQVLEKKKDGGVSHEAAVKLAHDEAFHEVVMPRDYMWDDLLNADNPALAVDKALRKFQELNEQFTAIADLDDYGDVEAFTKQENNRLDQLLRHLESRNLSRYRIPPDMLGEAYMDLVKHFAIEEGRDGGEFFTPPEIVELMVRLIEPYEKNTDIHDPTCGAGGMLVQVAQHLRQVQGVDEEHWRSVRFTGQEVNATVHAMAEMNLAIHDVEGEIRREDSLANPQFTDGENDLEEFNYILANFPFSTSQWKDATKKRVEKFGDLDWSDSLPHGNYGDFAFIMHMFSHLSDDGQMATVIPHGVLFRNGDQEYREYLIENDLIEAVIGLPENLFETTGIPSGILILNKDKPEDREGEILFFNADHEGRFYEDTGSDRYKLLAPEFTAKTAAEIEDPNGIAEIKQLFDGWSNQESVCRVVSNDEVREKGYHLNIALYVDTTEPEVDIDVEEAVGDMSQLEDRYSELSNQLDTYVQQLSYMGEDADKDKRGLSNDLVTRDIRVTPDIEVNENILDNSPSKVEDDKEWSTQKIKEIADINPESFDPDESDENTLPYLSLSCVSSGSLVDVEEIEVDDPPSRAKRVVREGDVLLGKVRPKQESHYRITKAEEGYIVSSGFVVLRPTDEVESGFLIQQILSHKFYEQMEAWATGNSYPSVNTTEVGLMTIDVPPLWEQERIASVLYVLDEMIQTAENMVTEHKSIKRGLMQDLFED